MKRLLLLLVAAEVLVTSSTAFASPGATIWTKRYNGPGNGYDRADSVGVSPDGTRVFVTGSSAGPGGAEDYATVAYSASTGSKLWVARFNGSGNGAEATSLGVSPDGTKVFVTGSSTGSGGADDYATVAYDASTGHTLWVARYNGPGNDFDDARALAVSPDGTEVFVTGGSTGNGTDSDYATIAYAA